VSDFIDKNKKITLYFEKSITFNPVANAVAIYFLDRIIFYNLTYKTQI
jgi:hypothetical protein